jgi:hypothetical protein
LLESMVRAVVDGHSSKVFTISVSILPGSTLPSEVHHTNCMAKNSEKV